MPKTVFRTVFGFRLARSTVSQARLQNLTPVCRSFANFCLFGSKALAFGLSGLNIESCFQWKEALGVRLLANISLKGRANPFSLCLNLFLISYKLMTLQY